MSPILSQSDLILAVTDAKRNALSIVFTNGVFDLLHPGHIHTLESARALGDLLIVAINSDASTRRLKGPSRPVTPQLERAEILAALECVSYVTIFDEDTPLNLISLLLPTILVKGGDWSPDEIVGRHEVVSAGGRVVSIPLEPAISTSAILSRISQLPPR